VRGVDLGFRLAARAGVPPFYVMRVIDAVVARRRAGLFVADLSAGQPSTGAPAPVRAAAHAALDTDRIGYTSALGIPPLREAIARHYRDRVGLDVDPANVVVTTGSSGAFLYAFLAAFDAGDAVAMARPGYPAYRNMLTALGCECVNAGAGRMKMVLPVDFELRDIYRLAGERDLQLRRLNYRRDTLEDIFLKAMEV